MPKSEFTKAPWHRNIRAAGKYPTVFAGRNKHIAVVSQSASPEETEANIDLIAAAPELLEALKDALALIESYKTARYSRIASDCKAAIAKAEGK